MSLLDLLRDAPPERRHKAFWRVVGVTVIAIVTTMAVSLVWGTLDKKLTMLDIFIGSIVIPLCVAPIASISGTRAILAFGALADEQHRLANVDALTGLPNRRAFMARAQALQAMASEARLFVCLIGDADDFKQVNDSHGHLVGDDVLSFLGQQLSALETDDGIVARLGGEEFAVAGLFDSVEAARTYGETLVGSIARQTFVGRGVTLSVTISMGLAVDRGGEGVSALLSRADKALYRAKADGKNCLAEAA